MAAINKHLATHKNDFIQATNLDGRPQGLNQNYPSKDCLCQYQIFQKETFTVSISDWVAISKLYTQLTRFRLFRVLLSSLKHHKEWGSHHVRTYLRCLYRVCSCAGTEPVAAVKTPSVLDLPLTRHVGAFSHKQVAELRPPLRQKLVTWTLLHKTESVKIRFEVNQVHWEGLSAGRQFHVCSLLSSKAEQ